MGRQNAQTVTGALIRYGTQSGFGRTHGPQSASRIYSDVITNDAGTLYLRSAWRMANRRRREPRSVQSARPAARVTPRFFRPAQHRWPASGRHTAAQFDTNEPAKTINYSPRPDRRQVESAGRSIR